MKKLSLLLVGVLLFTVSAFSQINSVVLGAADASAFAYGETAGAPALQVLTGSNNSGTYTITVVNGTTSTTAGQIIAPLNVNAPFFIGTGASFELVPASSISSVSCSTPTVYNTCSVTATFSYAHNTGDAIRSGTYGLQEAINWVQANGGDTVALNGKWSALGGTNATLSAATPYAGVTIEDYRNGSSQNWWSVQPSTISLISAPTTLTSSTVTQPASCPTGASCTWTAAEPYFCVAYVDILGQLSACSASYAPSSNLTASLPVNITAPAASAGAVGYVVFAGASYNASFLLPVVSTAGVANGACTLTTLETVFPACAVTNATYGQVGSSASFNTIYSNTNMQTPFAAQSTSNLTNPVYQAHTAFAYQPSGVVPVGFETVFPLWPANTATESASDVQTLGTVNLPIGYLNTIGRRIRVKGKAVATVTTASTAVISILDGWQGGYSTGAPAKTLCALTSVGTPTGTTVNFAFDAVITVQAVGTTAVGATLCDAYGVEQAGTALPISVVDNGSATTVSSIGLFTYDQLFVQFQNTATASSAVRLIDLSVETIQ